MESKFAPGFYSQKKELQFDQLEIEGNIPDWLSGSLLRTGPSIYELEHQSYNHWYDGLAMLYKFSFNDGKVGFHCKYLKSKSYLKATKTGKVQLKEWATDPCKNVFEKVKSYFIPPALTDNGNINIIKYDDEVLATSETPLPISFNKDTLATQMQHEFDDDLKGEIDPAHVHYDDEGNVYSYLLKYSLFSKYQIYKMERGSNSREKITSIPVLNPAYMHSFAFTENFIILVEFPYLVVPMEMVFTDKPLIKNYRWKPDHGTTYQVIDKRSGNVKKFKGDPIFAFHHVNAYEEDGHINVDMVLFEDDSIINHLYLDELRANSETFAAGILHRASIDMTGTKGVELQKLSDKLFELPRINYDKFNGKEYRYVYGAGSTVSGNWLDDITKVDVKSGDYTTWYEEHHYPSEPVFVQRPGASEEDDGVLISVVLESDKKITYLLVLDAQSLEVIAKAKIPEILPFSFHGVYLE